MKPRRALALFAALLGASAFTFAQQSVQPPPFTAPNPPLPAAPQAPNQQPVPQQQQQNAPLPQTQPGPRTSDLNDIPPLAPQPASSPAMSFNLQHDAGIGTVPIAEAPIPRGSRYMDPYRTPRLPELPAAPVTRLTSLIHDGKLFLSLHDALALAIENNLDVEVGRYNLLLADTDVTRAQGGGTLRGLDFTIQQTAPGVGAATTPLLITATTGLASPTNTNVIDLSQVTQTALGTQQNLSENSTNAFSTGPALPLFDPNLFAEAGYYRRSNQTSLIATTGSTPSQTLDYVNTGIDYQQGFSPGTQIDAYVDNAAQVLYASNTQLNPFHAPSTSFTLTQPLLRSRGRAVNLRFLRIAQTDRKVSRLLFTQQLLETVYGVSRLYFDLVSLGENIAVKQAALAASQKLYDDDRDQVEQGTLATIELTRAQALLSSSRLDLIQAQGEYRQQEVILKEQLLRRLTDAPPFASIIPTDPILVPDAIPTLDVPALTADALANRPDLAQAALQLRADELSAKAAGNNAKPLLNLYANVQTRGSSLVPYQTVGSLGTGIGTVPSELTQGGIRLSTVYQAGLQLNLPLRNRIAEADAARDAIQLRQAQGRTVKLENDIRVAIEASAIALETAHQAYAAAVESRNFQQQLLQAEIDKFAVGASTNLLIIQDQSYLAQANSTEVAARSNWIKARISLDRALGNLLEKNNIQLEDAVSAHLPN